MSWFTRLFRGASASAPAGGLAGSSAPSARAAGEAGDRGLPPLRCQTCGKPLGFDDEDEPTGDAGGPICGECNRSRNFDVLLETQ